MEKIRASKCEIRENADEFDFLNENHYQGWCPSKIKIGLFYNDELVEVMTFGKPRFNHFYDWELLRLCTKKDYIVYGGASKLFDYFLENYDIGNGVISYCNRDLFSGKVYEVLGFKSNGIKKGYHYIKDGVKVNRYQMQKNKSKIGNENIQKTIESFGGVYHPELSEKENAELNGFVRVNDKIGQELFIFNDKARMFIYKITFDDDSTYIGQHIAYKENDGYITSSTYYKNGHQIKSLETLIEVDDRFSLDLMETVCILDDKVSSPKNVNGNYGNYYFNHPFRLNQKRDYKWSAETREKFCNSMRGHKISEETKKKISEANKGKKRTDEQKKNISEAHKGYIMPEEQKKKIAESMKGGNSTSFKKGHIMSEETKKKISETMKGKTGKY